MDKQLLDDIIWHYRHPAHRGRSKGKKYTAQNLSCGDSIEIYLQIMDGIVKSASFSGELCSIASYGADQLLEYLIGRPLADLTKVTSADLLGEGGASLLQNPVRLKCFELAQSALHKKPQ